MKQRFSLPIGCVCLLIAIGLATFTVQATPAAGDFVRKATNAGEFEIASSRLALQTSQDPQIKQFAQQMVSDHTKASAELKSLISQPGTAITKPPTGLDADHQSQLNALNKLTGKDFDAKYVSDQVKAHKEAVALFSDYAKSGDNANLKNFAAQTLPTLEQHQAMIKQIKASE